MVIIRVIQLSDSSLWIANIDFDKNWILLANSDFLSKMQKLLDFGTESTGCGVYA